MQRSERHRLQDQHVKRALQKLNAVGHSPTPSLSRRNIHQTLLGMQGEDDPGAGAKVIEHEIQILHLTGYAPMDPGRSHTKFVLH